MTTAEWDAGVAELIDSGIPGLPAHAAEKRARIAFLRRALDHLDPAAWRYACREAGEREQWWPVASTLREYAESYRAPFRPGLPPAPISREEAAAAVEDDREQRRASSRRGLAVIEEVCRAAGVPLRSEVVRSMPRAKRDEEPSE